MLGLLKLPIALPRSIAVRWLQFPRNGRWPPRVRLPPRPGLLAMAVEFLEAAQDELVAETVAYERIADGLGERFAQDVEQALALIERHPLAGEALALRWRGFEVRRVPLHMFPFRLVYVAAMPILIVAVAHVRRRPEYWRRGRDRK